MTYKNMHARSGLTAIAAVLALSSTPIGAQEVTTPPDPAIETPSEPAPAADPLSPEPSASEPAATEPAATEVAPAATTRRAPARSRSSTTDRNSGQPVRTAAPVSAPQPAETAAETLPVAPLPAEPMAEPVAPPAAEPVPASAELMADEALPIAGAAGVGLLALGGLGLALQRRRRRRDELEHYQANQQYFAEHPEQPVPDNNQPAFFRAAPAQAVAAASALPEAEVFTDAPRTKLPADFDLSRFGPHVRAAYMGPTPDNPSLSLKYRLRKAAALDQRARLEAEQRSQARTPEVRPDPAKAPAWNSNEGFMLRRAGSNRPSRPAYQS